MWRISDETKVIDREQLNRARAAASALKSRSDLGFLALPGRTALWKAAAARGHAVRRSADRLAVLGMGGSSLGGRALVRALAQARDWGGASHEVIFVDNVDAVHFQALLGDGGARSKEALAGTHWVIVSKSGNTIETLTMAELIDQRLRMSGLPALSTAATVISEPADNPLTRWARAESVACLEIPRDVGGRYSVLTPVGTLPAAFCGLDLERLREGAAWALGQDDLVAHLTAQTLMSFARGEWVTLHWAYADGLRDYGFWMQQLWAESLGKAVDRAGNPAPRASTPMPAVGSSDQHSILQQVMEGARDKFLWFLRVDECEAPGPAIQRTLFDCQGLMLGKGMGDLFGAMADATRSALESQGVQSLTLRASRLDEASVGALFMLSELVVGALGEALNIDAFNQPGVELGKKLARGLLHG